ncbi:flagellar biosynthetic protein FliO [Methylobacillus pratensis]
MKRFLVMACLLANIGFMHAGMAAGAEERAAPTKPIPFKTTDSPLQTHGSRVGWIIIGFLLVAWGAAYYLKRKNPKAALQLLGRTSEELKILDKVRLNHRSHLYVVEFDNRKVLVGQTGDRLVTLAESEGKAAEEGGPGV